MLPRDAWPRPFGVSSASLQKMCLPKKFKVSLHHVPFYWNVVALCLSLHSVLMGYPRASWVEASFGSRLGLGIMFGCLTLYGGSFELLQLMAESGRAGVLCEDRQCDVDT